MASLGQFRDERVKIKQEKVSKNVLGSSCGGKKGYLMKRDQKYNYFTFFKIFFKGIIVHVHVHAFLCHL